MNATGWGIALGYFDGVHIGHRKLIERLCLKSSGMGLGTMVYTFDNHPQNVVRPEEPIPLIYPPEDKFRILCGLGVDRVEMASFNINVSRMSPQGFFEEVLLKKHNIKYGVVGFNFRFGKGGKGDVSLLRSLAGEYGVIIDVVEPVMLGDKLVSSSYIRQLLLEGDIKRANACLGKKYTISGRVIKGKGRGNSMGIPTANLRLPEGVLYPARGVYATNTLLKGRRYKSITNVGVNPTFADGGKGVETYICGINDILYDSFIEVEFFDRIREEKKFTDREELRKQIELDIKNLENYF
jgi:riboflavin kinase/FMN adenylyltransferase